MTPEDTSYQLRIFLHKLCGTSVTYSELLRSPFGKLLKPYRTDFNTDCYKYILLTDVYVTDLEMFMATDTIFEFETQLSCIRVISNG